jgi:hypothetical protein
MGGFGSAINGPCNLKILFQQTSRNFKVLWIFFVCLFGFLICLAQFRNLKEEAVVKKSQRA